MGMFWKGLKHDLMIIVRIKCGLGNQLFQYAAAYALSRRLKQPLQLECLPADQRPYRLDQLNVIAETIKNPEQIPWGIGVINNKYVKRVMRVLHLQYCRLWNVAFLWETYDRFIKEFFTVNVNTVYLDGYFQSELYFKPYKAELQKHFTPRYSADSSYLQVLSEINNCNAVAVHVRRGDFKTSVHPFHYLLTEDYYKRAIAYIRKRVDSPVFFWFSEDFEWVREHFAEERDFRFVSIKTKNGDIDDMMLMKNCKHIITANSTFSWWAAWLNEHEDAIRIVPAKPFGIKEMIPDNWVKLPI